MDTQAKKTAHTDNIVPIADHMPRRRRVRRHPVRVFIYVLFFAAVITGLILFVTYRNQLTADAFNDLISRLRFFGQGDEDQAETFSYDDYMLSRFASFQRGVALLSEDRLVIYGPSGQEKYGVDCAFGQPALAVSDRTVLAYDRGGQSVILTDNSTTLLKKDWDGALITACMNRKGAFALVSAERGYASVCNVFDDRQREIYKWYSRDQYILSASLSPSTGLLALCSYGQEPGGRQTGRVTLLDTGRDDKPVMTRDLPDTMPLGVGFMSEKLFYTVTEADASFYNEKGELLLDWSFGGRRLLDYAASDEGFLALCLSGGDAFDLLVLDEKGVRVKRTVSGKPDALSVAGGWVGLLTGGEARVYNAGLEDKGPPCATDALALLMRGDGTALLLGKNGSTVFKP